jgi:protein involved in polysaccharide export with SLBB domain
MRVRAGLLWVLGIALVAMAAAGPSLAAEPSLDANGQGVQSAEYRIAAGDELDIVLPLNPEFNVRTFVRPDGKISLELIDEIAAEGLTTAELTEHLRNAYSTELRDPEISVNVVSMAARIYVDGHVERPGEYPWSRQVTAMQAVSLAGGLRETADGESLLVVRRSPGGEQRVFQIDLEELASGEGPSQDLFLAPYDTVYVPSSRVADVNKWMDQYIRENIPISPRKVVPGGVAE